MFSPSRVFISYRRSDSEPIARALYEALKARFGQDRIFFDTASIPFGEDFRRIVRERIRRSAVVLVVIGPDWADARNERGPRLWQEDDPVRFELATALESGRRIVPLRVGGASAPAEASLPPELRALPFLNMPQLHADSFDSDVNALCRQLVGESDDLTLWQRVKALLVAVPVAVPLIALALLAATWTGAFALFGLDSQLQRLLLAAGSANPGEPVLLVRIDAASESALRREFGVPGTAAAWRRDHARLIEAMARSGATAVAFDLFFEDEQHEADLVLAAAARRAMQAATPMRVVFGARQLVGREPDLVAPLREAGRWGSLCLAHRGNGALWTTPLAVAAVRGGGSAMTAADRPSLALAAWAPGRLIEADAARRELRFDGPSPDPPIRYSAVERQRVEAGGCRTAGPGDATLDLLLRIAPAGHWRDPVRSVSYAEALALPVGDPRVRGRVVLVGATDFGRAAAIRDVQVVQEGFAPRNVFGVELQADAVATLASGRVPRLPTVDQQLATTLIAAFAGLGLGFWLYRQASVRRRLALLGASALFAGLAWLLARQGFLLDLANALVSLWLAALAARGVQWLAERRPRFRRLST